MARAITLSSHVADERRRGLAQDVAGALLDLSAGVKAVAAVLARAMVCGAVGGAGCEDAPTKLSALTSDLLVEACAGGGHAAAVASEEMAAPRVVFGRQARCVVAIGPLDAASSLEVNAAAGTAFSVLRQPQHLSPGTGAFLQPGERQVAAGYALYGPCTMLVVTSGREVNGFTLDGAGEFVLTHPRLRIPDAAREPALATPGGGSRLAGLHRVLLRGGALVCGADGDGAHPPRLVFEASPMAMLVERAGGAASTGHARLLEVVPGDLRARVPSILGSRREVERLASIHADPGGGLDRRAG